MTLSILIVDDDDPFRSVLARTFRRESFVVYEASDGVKALAKLAEVSPTILLTDMLMPKCDGVELIVAARRQHPDMRIVAMSAKPHIGALDLLGLARRVGADAAYLKGLQVETLIATVRELLPAL